MSAPSLTPADTGTAIFPLMCRDESSTFTFAKRCLAEGLYVPPIVFPAAPQNATRIRCSITAALSEEDLKLALEVIGRHRGCWCEARPVPLSFVFTMRMIRSESASCLNSSASPTRSRARSRSLLSS